MDVRHIILLLAFFKSSFGIVVLMETFGYEQLLHGYNFMRRGGVLKDIYGPQILFRQSCGRSRQPNKYSHVIIGSDFTRRLS